MKGGHSEVATGSLPPEASCCAHTHTHTHTHYSRDCRDHNIGPGMGQGRGKGALNKNQCLYLLDARLYNYDACDTPYPRMPTCSATFQDVDCESPLTKLVCRGGTNILWISAVQSSTLNQIFKLIVSLEQGECGWVRVIQHAAVGGGTPCNATTHTRTGRAPSKGRYRQTNHLCHILDQRLGELLWGYGMARCGPGSGCSDSMLNMD